MINDVDKVKRFYYQLMRVSELVGELSTISYKELYWLKIKLSNRMKFVKRELGLQLDEPRVFKPKGYNELIKETMKYMSIED